MTWWAWVALVWTVLLLPIGVIIGRMIRAGDAGSPCRLCGHAPRDHEHYWPGTDCALCDCSLYVAG